MENVLSIKNKYKVLNYININKLKKISQNHKLYRARYCIHNSINSHIHQMLICLNSKTIIDIHSHPKKYENIFVIEGVAELIFYNKQLKIEKKITLNKRNFFVEIPKNQIHRIKVKSKYFIFVETTKGPFKKKDTIYF